MAPFDGPRPRARPASRGARDRGAGRPALPRRAAARRGVLRAGPPPRLVPADGGARPRRLAGRLAAVGAGARLRPAAAGGSERAGALSADLALAAAAVGHGLHGIRARAPLRGPARSQTACRAPRRRPRRCLGRWPGFRALGSRAVRTEPVASLRGHGVDAVGAARVRGRGALPVHSKRAGARRRAGRAGARGLGRPLRDDAGARIRRRWIAPAGSPPPVASPRPGRLPVGSRARGGDDVCPVVARRRPCLALVSTGPCAGRAWGLVASRRRPRPAGGSARPRPGPLRALGLDEPLRPALPAAPLLALPRSARARPGARRAPRPRAAEARAAAGSCRRSGSCLRHGAARPAVRAGLCPRRSAAELPLSVEGRDPRGARARDAGGSRRPGPLTSRRRARAGGPAPAARLGRDVDRREPVPRGVDRGALRGARARARLRLPSASADAPRPARGPDAAGCRPRRRPPRPERDGAAGAADRAAGGRCGVASGRRSAGVRVGLPEARRNRRASAGPPRPLPAARCSLPASITASSSSWRSDSC